MGREINRLSARRVQTLTDPGRYADGGGLYLVVDAAGAKRWVMLYRVRGRRREMGLGSAVSVTLAAAREKAREARAAIDRGEDPVETRKASRQAPRTFGEVAEEFMAAYGRTWRNDKHRAQWRSTLQTGAAYLWGRPVATITVQDILRVLQPIWETKPETAQRIRGRIERVIDAARAKGERVGDNPAQWRGHLDKILPPARKLARGHHPAMPRAELPAFCRSLAENLAPSAAALRFIILTAARSGEVRGMTWGEIDMQGAIWTVPAARMKGGRLHRVPLSAAALVILRDVRPEEPSPTDLVFPAVRSGKIMSDMAFTMYLRRAGLGHYTVHGFRSTFRDWVAEETEFPGDLAEAALAHLTGDETERAYRRGDALERRRHLMDAWARFVASDIGA